MRSGGSDYISLTLCFRIDGALEPWLRELTGTLSKLFPMPPGLDVQSADGLPPSRVSMTDADATTLAVCVDPLDNDPQHHIATVSCNRRITAEDWFQDVRHFELDFDEDVRCVRLARLQHIQLTHRASYEPGDVVIVRPEAQPSDVEAFLVSAGFHNTADDPITITRTLRGNSHMLHYHTATHPDKTSLCPSLCPPPRLCGRSLRNIWTSVPYHVDRSSYCLDIL